MEIVLGHVHPDLDALAATVAGALLHPGAIPVIQDLSDPAVHEVVATHRDALGLRDLGEVDLAAVTRVVVVDARSQDRLGDAYAALARPGVAWEVYDHHPRGPGELPPSPGRRELVGAATSLIVELLAARDVAVTPLQATVMALGIYADTGRLTYPSTTATDAQAVAWLLARGADLEIIGRHVEDELGEAQRALLDQLTEAAAPRRIHGYATLVVGARADGYVGGVAAIAHKLQALLDLDVVVVVAELGPKRTQLVGRSRVAGGDLRPALAPWEPRGHPRAVSAKARGVPFEAAVEQIWAALPAALPPEPMAADLMSSPVRTIGPEASIEAARAALLDHGHNALVVLEDGRVAGVVSRRDLDRATRHGLGGAAVRDVMSRRVRSTTPDAPLSAIEAAFVEADVGRLPVMRGDALVGIVTRQDVLRAKYDHHPDRRAAVAHQTAALADRLAAAWPADWLAALAQVGAAGEGRPVYLVGGAVRDLLLGRPNLDVDLVVEGDGIAFARRAAQAIPGTTLKAHPPFGTAQLRLPDGKKVDVATARTEHYERPAALPTVAFSTLKQDLARRDFSVNCLALRVDDARRGELIDFFGAQADLGRRVLRVLHNLSFVEDPTRVLRAVRFEAQLGFRLAPESEAFARRAMATGAFDGLGGERNRAELRRILELPDPIPALRRLADLGGLRILHPAAAPADGFRAARWALRVARRLDDPEGAWLAPLIALLAPLGAEAAGEVAARLNLAGAERDAVAVAVGLAAAWLPDFPPAGAEPIQVVDALKNLTPAGFAALFALSTTPAQRCVLAAYWTRWRDTRLSVTGEDLKALGLPPGPRYAEILRQVLAARLAGRIGPAQEQGLLRELAAGHPAERTVRP